MQEGEKVYLLFPIKTDVIRQLCVETTFQKKGNDMFWLASANTIAIKKTEMKSDKVKEKDSISMNELSRESHERSKGGRPTCAAATFLLGVVHK